MNEMIQSDLIGARIEMKPKQVGYHSSLDSDNTPIIGVVRLIACFSGGDVVFHIEDADGWIQTRSTLTNVYRVLLKPGEKP